ncbi:unnamed protein product [Sphagnum compactum]
MWRKKAMGAGGGGNGNVISSSKNNFLLFSLVLIATALLTLCFSSSFPSSSSSSASFFSPLHLTNHKRSSSNFPVYSHLLHPCLETWNNQTEFVYQLPETPPKAVLFLAHGCSCKATFFWDKAPGCTSCIGLPEDRALVLGAIEKSFAVIAISSLGVCWSQEHDADGTREVLLSWIARKGLVGLPLFGLGASSGGYFLSVFANSVDFNAIVVMIAEGRFQEVAAMPEDGASSSSYPPPVLFVHMPRDRIRAARIVETIAMLKSVGIDVEECKCMKMQITRTFFSQRIPYIDEDLSRQIQDFLNQSGFLDNRGFLKRDGRDTGFEDAMKEKQNRNLLLTLSAKNDDWEHHIREELNVAYALHEFTSLPSTQIFSWFDSHMSISAKLS